MLEMAILMMLICVFLLTLVLICLPHGEDHQGLGLFQLNIPSMEKQLILPVHPGEQEVH